MQEPKKKKVFFICTHNSNRSQMAEGFLRAMYGDSHEACSAGTHPTNVSSYAVEIMAEAGIDISAHRSKSIDQFHDTEFDYVVTVCDRAKETCPFFPAAASQLHKSFQDPLDFHGSEDEIMTAFRHLRDEIKLWVQNTFGEKDEKQFKKN